MNDEKDNGYIPTYDSYCGPCSEIPKKKNETCSRQIALNASIGSAGPLPIITTLLANPINVVSTTIDTAGMGNTNNLLTFIGTVNLPVGISVTLNFQIQRVYNHGNLINVGSTYTYSTTVNILEAEEFSFQFFDANVPEGVYTYAVSLSTNSIIDITPGVTINAVLKVMAVAV